MAMFPNLKRAVFTVTQHEEGWAVEHDGHFFDASLVRDEVLAAASRRARASNENGLPAQIRLQGELGFTLR
ncbi:MAG TPA: hypothetical protein VL358_02555 [Caulobacteraceae bacterium]|jgi:hypothetical protein|nr:hypothetical protein [Caulobacteraceae bacterium]